MAKRSSRIDAAREIVKAVEGADRKLKRLLGGQHALRFLGAGQSSVVFALGTDRVLRVSRGMDLVDCEVPELLLERRPNGWPKVHHMVMVEAEDGTACIVIAEKMRPWSVLSRKEQEDLDDAALVVSTAHFRWNQMTPKTERLEATPGFSDLPKRAKVWAKQLWRGLEEIDRVSDTTDLDTTGDNYGLNSRGDAVWIDFGI